MKLKYKIIIITAILAIIPISLYSGRIYTLATLSGRANEPSCNPDFNAAIKCLAVNDVSKVTYFRGLPHYYAKTKAFNHSVWNDDYFSVAGYPFHSAEMNPKQNDSTEVIKMVTNASYYKKYIGPKLCGGYHADLAVRITHKDGISWLLLCFGCEEIIILNESGVSYIIEMKKSIYDYMLSLFKDIA
jgi:hypothetical protein